MGMMTRKLGNGFEFIKKACFICGSFNHLIKDYDFHDKKMVEKPVLNNKGMVTAVAIKSGQVPVNAAKQSSPKAVASISTARPVNTVAPKPKVNDALPTTYSYFKAHSPVRRAFNKKSAAKTNNFNENVNTVRVNNVTTAGPKAIVSATVGNGENGFRQKWLGPQENNSLIFECRIIKRLMVDLLHLEEVLKEIIEPVNARNQTNKNTGIKDNVGAIPTQQYILLPLLYDSPQSSKDAVADDAGKKTNKEPANEGERNGQDKEGGVSNKEDDQNVIVSPSISAAGQSFDNTDFSTDNPIERDPSSYYSFTLIDSNHVFDPGGKIHDLSLKESHGLQLPVTPSRLIRDAAMSKRARSTRGTLPHLEMKHWKKRCCGLGILSNKGLAQSFFDSINTDPFFRPQWANLFQINEPIFRELARKFFASFEFDATPYRVGLYSERESRDVATLSGLRNAETINATHFTHMFWPTIGDDGYNVGNMKAKSIRNPMIKLVHQCITMTITGRKETTNRGNVCDKDSSVFWFAHQRIGYGGGGGDDEEGDGEGGNKGVGGFADIYQNMSAVVPAGSSSSVPADYVSASHVLVSADRDRIR
ncbi:hypothetical protein Tco_0571627 [Tanacetum coccineum]